MVLKQRILVILVVTSFASSLIMGALLIFLVELFGEVSFDPGREPVVTILAIACYLLAGLGLIGLLNLLLNKKVVVPAVEKSRLENERVMLTDQLHQAQKLEAVGRLAGSIAHDFNNLLTVIDGYSSLIIADPASPETGENAKEVVEAARKASFITRKLLSFSQKEKTEPLLLDLNVTLQDTDKMLSRLIGEKITLITKPHSEPILVLMDPVQLGQVLMNLAVNARDAMPNGGRITIKIGSRIVNDGECSKPAGIPPGEFAEIAVHDTGHGMDADTLARIFEPFFSTKATDKGTGLGLSIVKSIVKQSDGFINVTSKAGGGSTFFIYLPTGEHEKTQEAEVPEVSAAQSAEPAGAPREATILLVEDDPMIRTLVSHSLEEKGYVVLQAEEGWEGIKVARQYKAKIDLLFTDVIMPGLGGAELAVAAKELCPEIKVLFMSGYSRAQLDEEGVPSDAAVLEKPFMPDQVVAKVNQLLGA